MNNCGKLLHSKIYNNSSFFIINSSLIELKTNILSKNLTSEEDVQKYIKSEWNEEYTIAGVRNLLKTQFNIDLNENEYTKISSPYSISFDDETLTLSWNSVTGATSYDVNINGMVIKTDVTSTSYVVPAEFINLTHNLVFSVRAKNKDILTDENIKKYPIGNVFNGLPIEFSEVPFELVIDACLDTLGVLDTSHLTLNFIIKMGLYFTQQEMQQPVNKLYGDNKHGLYEKDLETGKAKNRLDIIKRELKLNPAINLRICDTGLNYNEFRSMYYLKRDKYSNLTTDQLKLLATKVLYRFQEQCNAQAKQWESKINEIKEVANIKGWELLKDNMVNLYNNYGHKHSI